MGKTAKHRVSARPAALALTTLVVTTLVVTALAMAAAWPATASEVVVVEARGIALKAGQVLDDTQPLVLLEGQRVTLIAANGNTLKLRGPYDQAPGSGEGGGGANLAQALTALIVQKQTRTSEVGVVRGEAEAAKLPEPWLFDVTRPGNVCVRDGSPIVFWRPSATSPANLTVLPTDKSWRLTTVWPTGDDRLILPERYTTRNRATYLIDLGSAHAAVTLNVIPAAAATDAMRAAWMIEKGCQAQAEALLTALR
jgi:hypothetical protein